MILNSINFRDVCRLARIAGKEIMSIYATDFNVEFKRDASPLTCADRSAHKLIIEGLQEFSPEIPILSEEGRVIPYRERSSWQRFWLVDPLDGTTEFIKRNDEFTVNIALIEGGLVRAGVVYVPAQEKTYLGIKEKGSWLMSGDQLPTPISVRETNPDTGLTVLLSRSHPSAELAGYLQNFRIAKLLPVGSSLKFCMVAAGEADLYPRLGPTMEWDTAAGHAVVEGAGGTVMTIDGRPLTYNKENLSNPHFVVKGN